MRDHRMNYVAVGVFVIAMLAALIGVVSMMMGRTGASDAYHVVLDNVADVKFGTQVRYEGYTIGQVEHIEPIAEGAQMRFRIDVSVRKPAGACRPTASRASAARASSLPRPSTSSAARAKCC